MKKFLQEALLALCLMGAALTAGLMAGEYFYPVEIPVHKAIKLGSVVRLVTNNETFCTGTVVSPTNILTAAHCVASEPLFGIANYRQNIEIRPADNTDVGVPAKVFLVLFKMDQAILKGDFSRFYVRPVESDVATLIAINHRTSLTACGYPMGGPLYCAKVTYKEPDDFFWKVEGVLIPGMSGGGVYLDDGTLVATNVGVTGKYSIVSPTYNMNDNLDKQEK